VPLEALFTLVLVAVTIWLFVKEVFPPELTALVMLAVLLLTGITNPRIAFEGFSNPATFTVACMFPLSAGLYKTGALQHAGIRLARLATRSPRLAMLLMITLAGGCSAFLNNTAIMAIFLPVAQEAARRSRQGPSQFLMPLSFAVIAGGMVTLIGSSSNLLISSIAERSGEPALELFDSTRLGLLILGTTIVYFLLFPKLLPRQSHADLTDTYEMKGYLTEIVLLAGFRDFGQTVAASSLVRDYDLDVLAVFRGGEWMLDPPESIVLQEGDQLRIRCDAGQLQSLRDREMVRLRAEVKIRDADFNEANARLLEVVVAPRGTLAGESLKSSRFYEKFGARVLAIRHRGQFIHQKISHQILEGGDTLLVEAQPEEIEALRREDDFVLIASLANQPSRKGKRLLAVLIVLGVVAAAATGAAPMVAAALSGCLALVFTGCLTLEEAQESIDWRIIVLLGAISALGIALETTGGAGALSKYLIALSGSLGAVVVLAGIWIAGALLTEVMSNNAVAALLAPVAVIAARQLGVDSKPFLLAVYYSCSLCMLSPFGYQTHMMVYGPGRYRTRDFVRAGGPLKLLVTVACLYMLALEVKPR
jgi:di/tricarboxylate transporter